MSAELNRVRRVLIVDPDAGLRLELSTVLDLSGYEVHHTGEGREAISMHQEKPFDVVITEIVMPGMDGLEILMALQSRLPVPKFILLSRKTLVPLEIFSKMALRIGAEHLLPKPFSSDEFLAVVRKVTEE